MATFQTLAPRQVRIFISLLGSVMFAVMAFLAVQYDPSRLTAAVVVESAKPAAPVGESAALPATVKDAIPTVDAAKVKESARALSPVVENRMTEEAEKAAAATKPLGRGEASYYGRGFAGRPTASGETFNPAEMTAAHRTLPFGSKVRVTNTNNGRAIVVRINDRGPFAHNRVIDLSQGAAERIGMIHSGTAQVKLELIS